MALDTLVLGSYVFSGMGVPSTLPGGGKQQLKIHKLAGGDRQINAMGPDDDDRQFEFTIFGANAVPDVLLLDAMRSSGSVYAYSNGVEARKVVIASFVWHFEKLNVAHCTLCLTPTDNPNGTSANANSMSPTQSASSDVASASATGATNNASQGGIGSDAVASGTASTAGIQGGYVNGIPTGAASATPVAQALSGAGGIGHA